jgi:hypothetical protein
MRKEGKFVGVDGSIPEGQGIVMAHLNECHELLEMVSCFFFMLGKGSWAVWVKNVGLVLLSFVVLFSFVAAEGIVAASLFPFTFWGRVLLVLCGRGFCLVGGFTGGTTDAFTSRAPCLVRSSGGRT